MHAYTKREKRTWIAVLRAHARTCVARLHDGLGDAAVCDGPGDRTNHRALQEEEENGDAVSSVITESSDKSRITREGIGKDESRKQGKDNLRMMSQCKAGGTYLSEWL
eukprot:3126357-Rhodomonas_salina.2